MANTLKQTAEEIVRQSMRDQGITQRFDMADGISGIMEGVTVDRKNLQDCLSRILQGNTVNPINALLRLFGFRLVSNNGAQKELDSLLSLSSIEAEDSGRLLSFVKLDEKTMRGAADKIAQSLGSLQRQWSEERQAQLERVNAMQADIDSMRQSQEQTLAQAERQRVLIAEQVQYMLSLQGKNGSMTGPLTELMEDLDLTVCWDAGDGALPEAAMYSTLKCDAPENRKMKPCILAGGRVLVKGLKFTAL